MWEKWVQILYRSISNSEIYSNCTRPPNSMGQIQTAYLLCTRITLETIALLAPTLLYATALRIALVDRNVEFPSPVLRHNYRSTNRETESMNYPRVSVALQGNVKPAVNCQPGIAGWTRRSLVNCIQYRIINVNNYKGMVYNEQMVWVEVTTTTSIQQRKQIGKYAREQTNK